MSLLIALHILGIVISVCHSFISYDMQHTHEQEQHEEQSCPKQDEE